MSSIYIILIAFVIFGTFIAATSNGRLNKVYAKYYTTAYINLTAGQITARAFDYFNMRKHKIAISKRHLSDGYSVSKKVIVLSEKNFYSKSVSAIAVAAHELGHALQHKDGYRLLTISFFMSKISKLNDILFFPGLITGSILFIFSEQYQLLGQYILLGVLILYVTSFVLKIVNIPLEINASKRALKFLKEEKVLDKDELKGARKVLTAASFTYFGSIFYGIIYFLRALDRAFK